MPDINFYLKKADDHGNRLIYLQMKYSGLRLVFSTGQNVKEGEWNSNKQRAKTSRLLTADKAHSINDLLDNLKDVLEDGYNAEIPDGIPAVDTLKEYLRIFMNKNIRVTEKKKPSFFEFLKTYIEENPEQKKYASLKKHLQLFNPKLTFDDINLIFFKQFTAWLAKPHKQINEGVRLKHNSIAKDIKSLRAVMNEAVYRKITSNTDYKHKKFSFPEIPVDNVALSEGELSKLYKHDFSHNPRLEQVRDLFMVGCWTGLRISDFSNLKPENITTVNGKKFIRVVTQKQKELVIAPCNEVILEIFKKYKHNHNSLPKSISDQKFNKNIKEACKIAGLTETNRLLDSPALELWQAVSSHTCRRSFCTNMYLSGFSSIDLMKISGHTSEAAFLKYIKVSKQQAAERMAIHQEKTRSQRQLNIAS